MRGMYTPRVLIVDDDHTVARMLSLILASAGATTQVITDPIAALDAIAAYRPQVVILDLMMPQLDGFELCRWIRDFPAAEGVMIIVVSGHSGPENKAKAIEAGANYYFVKPAEPARLIELVMAQ